MTQARDHAFMARAMRLAEEGLYTTDPNPRVGCVLVRRGQIVTLVAGGGPVEIRTTGKALADGAAGERVRVRNERSNRIVEGVVAEDGTVRVNP